jgi:heme-degrading monooxygenase HmoA
MVAVEHLDPATPLLSQLQADVGPVVLVNTFFVPSEAMPAFLDGWRNDAALMRTSPGFISTQMHRGIAGSRLLVNVASWESTAALRAAHSDPRFRERSSRLPDGVIAYPHVFEKIAVEGVCVA